jgi:hypothetical protein
LWTDDDHYEDADDGNGEENTEGRKAINDNMHSGVTRTGTRFRDVEAMDHTIEDATIGNVPEICVNFGKMEVNVKKKKMEVNVKKKKSTRQRMGWSSVVRDVRSLQYPDLHSPLFLNLRI